MDDPALKGIEQIIYGTYPAYRFTDEIVEAIKRGWAVDADPNWMYAERGACVFPVLTEEGRTVAFQHGLVSACRCAACDTTVAPRRYLGYCATCFASGKQYGMIEGMCAFHWLDEHPEVVEERLHRQDPAWLPSGVRKERIRPSPQEDGST